MKNNLTLTPFRLMVGWTSLIRNPIKIVGFFLTAALCVGCKPSAEQQARVEEQQRQHALNNFVDGDVLPKVDTTTQTVLKRGGKFFIAPKEYFTQGGMHGFYWPSKTPMYGGGADYPERAMVRSGKADAVAIAFQIEASSSTGETYGFIEQAEKNGTLIRRSQLRPDLEKVEIKSELQTGAIDLYFVATGQTTPAGIPPAIFCRPTHACTSGFSWKPGYRIYVRFSSQHGEDWPKIYPEIIRILNLLKEA